MYIFIHIHYVHIYIYALRSYSERFGAPVAHIVLWFPLYCFCILHFYNNNNNNNNPHHHHHNKCSNNNNNNDCNNKVLRLHFGNLTGPALT